MTQLRPIGTWLPNTTEWLELRLNLHWLSEYQQAEGRNASAWSLKLLDRGSRGIWKGALKASVLKLFSVPNWSGEVIFVFHRLLPFTLFLKQCIPRPPTPLPLPMPTAFPVPAAETPVPFLALRAKRPSLLSSGALMTWQAHSCFDFCKVSSPPNFIIIESYLLAFYFLTHPPMTNKIYCKTL